MCLASRLVEPSALPSDDCSKKRNGPNQRRINKKRSSAQRPEILNQEWSQQQMGSKSGFKETEVQEIKRLYLEEGRSYAQIARIIGRGSETSVKNALTKAKVNRSSEGGKSLEKFKPGQKFGQITLIKKLVKSKKLKYHAACDCGYEFDVEPYLLTLSNDHKNKVTTCPRCRARHK